MAFSRKDPRQGPLVSPEKPKLIDLSVEEREGRLFLRYKIDVEAIKDAAKDKLQGTTAHAIGQIFDRVFRKKEEIDE
jgi:hypothetical protein